jgi:hypothetical protein
MTSAAENEQTMNRIDLTSATRTAASRLEELLGRSQPAVLGMATAFLSLEGARKYDALTLNSGIQASRVVAGLAGAITNPLALRYLRERGHDVRLGISVRGIFHPKLMVGGRGFLRSGGVEEAVCGYVGSANFTGPGLERNLEVLFTSLDRDMVVGVADAFGRIWQRSERITAPGLRRYEQVFARAQLKRSLLDLELLAIVEAVPTRGRQQPIIDPRLCNAVWAGLQSFTGEHMFQVEFPRRAGEALGTLLRTKSGRVEVECSDGYPRNVGFAYYPDNGMYRLNVPNNLPLVEWVRTNHAGALLVWRDDDGSPDRLTVEIIRGRRLKECVSRSHALGTWGKTSTREFGWY